jgi:hypothetical protein
MHGVDTRVDDIVHRIAVLLLIEVVLEGQDGEEGVDIALDVLERCSFHAHILERLVVRWVSGVAMDVLRNVEMKPGYRSDSTVGIPLLDIRLHSAIAQDGAK